MSTHISFLKQDLEEAKNNKEILIRSFNFMLEEQIEFTRNMKINKITLEEVLRINTSLDSLYKGIRKLAKLIEDAKDAYTLENELTIRIMESENDFG